MAVVVQVSRTPAKRDGLRDSVGGCARHRLHLFVKRLLGLIAV